VVALAQLGFPNAVATLGTACTVDHVQKLFRFTDTVVFSFDGDSAGRRAARKALDGALPYATDVRSVKFLFLPPEHDPDSFIRAFGQEAFARCVSEAVPLSRFLIESAREGCDLASAEGRAHLASNAKPLWRQLPDGALKRQLLGEIAALVQLDPQELDALWHPPARSTPRSTPPGQSGGEAPWTAATGATRRPLRVREARAPRGRVLPLNRADQATRLLLAHSGLWDQLTSEDHQLLCSLSPPHGELLRWLEAQLHEHGHQPWAVLRQALGGQAHEAAALRLMTDSDLAAGDDHGENLVELRNLLDRMLIEHLKALETEAIEASRSNPAALARYRELQARRRALETTQARSPA